MSRLLIGWIGCGVRGMEGEGVAARPCRFLPVLPLPSLAAALPHPPGDVLCLARRRRGWDADGRGGRSLRRGGRGRAGRHIGRRIGTEDDEGSSVADGEDWVAGKVGGRREEEKEFGGFCAICAGVGL